MLSASVIIPTHNNSDKLKLVLRSLALQDFSSYEVIVVDDGSSDDTKEIAKDFRYLYQEDKGFRAGPARNLGASKAKGKLLIFLDDDSVVPGDFISNHINAKADVVLGYVALVEGVVSRLKREMVRSDSETEFNVIATGGLAEIIAPETRTIQVVDQHLLLKGLQLIYEMNLG